MNFSYRVENQTILQNVSVEKIILLINYSNQLLAICLFCYYYFLATGDKLWKGITTVSNAGKRKGRMRGLKKRKDLNRGQRLGDGLVFFRIFFYKWYSILIFNSL